MPSSKDQISRRKFLGMATAASLVGTGIYQWNEVDRIKVEKRDLHLPRWSADGFRVAFLTDFHVNMRHERDRVLRAVEIAVEWKPDVILCGGDYLNADWDSGHRHVDTIASRLGDSGIPTFAVLGNHDIILDDVLGMTQRCRERGMHILQNETREVGGVIIAGIDDGAYQRDRHDFLTPRQDKNVLAIFHEPDFVTRVDPKMSLVLSGHSHGGQICLPGGHHVHTPHGARKYIEGFYPEAKVPLYVSRGIGTTGPRLRSFCPAEVSLLTLRDSTAS
jgi:predicted MPP superfamily phosphohydrolase